MRGNCGPRSILARSRSAVAITSGLLPSAPGACATIGDSVHDLDSGRAAGMRVVGVLTGIASREDLAPHADVVLPGLSPLEESHYDVAFPQLSWRNHARASQPIFDKPADQP